MTLLITVFDLEQWTVLAITVALVILKAYALISALTFPDEAYKAGGKLTKAGWSIILAIGLVAQIFIGGIWIVTIVFTVAALVYLVDVKPTLRELVKR